MQNIKAYDPVLTKNGDTIESQLLTCEIRQCEPGEQGRGVVNGDPDFIQK